MKTYLLFALIFVVGFALVNGHKGRRHRGREQSAGSYAGMSRMMAGMPTKQRTMGGYRQALKKFKKFGIGGKHFTMGKQMMMGGFAFKPGRTDKPVPPFRKLKLCSTECRDECANFTTCRQDCNDRCGEVRVAWLCKRSCFANECLQTSCQTCVKSCFSERHECREENCARECSSRRGRRAFKLPQCKRCMAENCSGDEEEVEESQNPGVIETIPEDEEADLFDSQESLVSVADDRDRSFFQAVVDVVTMQEEEP